MRGQVRSIEFILALVLISSAVSYMFFFIPPYAPPEQMYQSAQAIARALMQAGVLDEILRNIYDPYYSRVEAIENATSTLSEILQNYGNPAYLYSVKIYEIVPSGFNVTIFSGSSLDFPPGPSYTYVGGTEIGGIDIRYGGGLSWPTTPYTYSGPAGAVPDWAKVLGCPTTNYAMVFEGVVVLNESGQWRFQLNADDGAVLYIDSKLVVDDWSGGLASGVINLEKGAHTVKIYWRQTTGAAILQLAASSPTLKDYKPVTVDNIASGALHELLTVSLGRPPLKPEVVVFHPLVVFTRAGVKNYLVVVEVGRT